MIELVHSTTADEHDSKGLIPLLEAIPEEKKKEIWVGKGYKTPFWKKVIWVLTMKGRL